MKSSSPSPLHYPISTENIKVSPFGQAFRGDTVKQKMKPNKTITPTKTPHFPARKLSPFPWHFKTETVNDKQKRSARFSTDPIKT